MHRKHLKIERPREGAVDSPSVGPWCGYEFAWRGDLYDESQADQINCPKCVAHLDQLAIARRPADAHKLELVKHEGPSAYRLTYKALVGGEHRAFVVLFGAYNRQGWRVCTLRGSNPEAPQLVGYEVEKPNFAGSRYESPIRFPSKWRALLAVEGLVADGELPTWAERAEMAREALVRQAERDAATQRQDAQDREDNQLADEGLKSLQHRGDLTNLELAAVEILIRQRERERRWLASD